MAKKQSSGKLQAGPEVKTAAVKKNVPTKKHNASLKPDKKTILKKPQAKTETGKVEKIRVKLPNGKKMELIRASGEQETEYENSVKKAMQDNNWSEVVSQEVEMIAKNASNEIIVGRRLHSLNELLYNAWSVNEPNADIGHLFLNCGGFEAVIAALRANLDDLKIQLMGFEALTVLVMKSLSDTAAAQNRLRKRVLRAHAAGGIDAVLKSIAIHKKNGKQLGDAVSFLTRMMVHCFDVDACRLERFSGAKAVMMAIYDEQDTEDLLASIDTPLTDFFRSGIRTFRVGVVHGYS